MRLLIVNYEYPPLGGGGGVLTQTLVRELAKRHDVTVLTSRAAGLPAESFEDGAHIVRVQVVRRKERERASLASLLSFAPAARRAGARILAGRPIDLVHTFFAVPSGPAGVALAKRAAVPHILTLVGADVYDPTRAVSPERFAPMRAMVRRVTGQSTAVVAISKDLATRAKAITGREGIEVIGCAAPALRFPPRSAPANGAPCTFVTVARLVRRKALGALVRAVPETGRLVVVGEGPERPTLEHAAAGKHVEFAGALDDEAKLQALSDADAFALVSLHEAFGIVYLEAMQAGLPVIAATVGGQTDFLTDDNAILVPPGDVRRIEEAMRSLAADPARRARMGAAARETAARYAPESMAAAYERVYETALGRKG